MNLTYQKNTTGYYETLNWSSNIWKILIVFISVSVCLVTQIGNILVLLSFRMNKKLRVTNNYFLVSLAIADLIIGIYSMPVFTIYVVADEWLLGPYFCDLWLCLDYTVSNASVASLLLISFDRYFSITRPLSYRANRTTKKVVILIALSWLISVIMWSPFILGWPYINGGRLIKDNECKVQFLQSNQYLTLITTFLAFYLPVTIIMILYFQIWRVTKRRQIELRRLQCQKFSIPRLEDSSNIKNLSDEQDASESLVAIKNNFERKKNKKIPSFIKFLNFSGKHKENSNNSDNSNENISENYKYKITYRNQICKSCEGGTKGDPQMNQNILMTKNDRRANVVKCSICNKVLSNEIGENMLSTEDMLSTDTNKSLDGARIKKITSSNKIRKKKASEKKADQKAAKTLSALLFAFLITWLPYNLNVVVNSFCYNCVDNYPYWQSFAYWLCYMNSTINPVLYAMCNASFRKTFKDILTCKKINQSI